MNRDIILMSIFKILHYTNSGIMKFLSWPGFLKNEKIHEIKKSKKNRVKNHVTPEFF